MLVVKETSRVRSVVNLNMGEKVRTCFTRLQARSTTLFYVGSDSFSRKTKLKIGSKLLSYKSRSGS